MQQKQLKLKISALWIIIATLGRLVVHPANTTPLTSLCVLSGRQFSLITNLLLTALTLCVSDALLAYCQGHAIFGWWTVFTYSGFLAITLFSTLFLNKKTASFKNTFIFTGIASIGFWLWTNFGTWLTTHIYPHTFQGLCLCYAAAVPFLRNALAGDLVWVSVLFFALSILKAFGNEVLV